jgi:glycosyltransferase involved in cell wall biosynthesis
MSRACEVSVVIATFRREQLVLEAIASALAQRDIALEVIVVDDSGAGSARRCVEALGDPRVRYIARDSPSGRRPGLVRNEGAAVARGEFLHFLDDDDKLADGALRLLADALASAPAAGMAFGRVVPFGDDPQVLANRRAYFEEAARDATALAGSRWRLAAQLLFRNTCLVNSGCLVRRSAHTDLGGYDPQIPIIEDIEFFLRVGRAHGFVFVDRPIVLYRTGAPSITSTSGLTGRAGDPRLVGFGRMYDKYKRQYGPGEFYALKIAVRGAGLLHRIVAAKTRRAGCGDEGLRGPIAPKASRSPRWRA